MKRKLIEAKCPYCKKEHNSFENWHKGISLISGEYPSERVTQTCKFCGEKFWIEVTETRRYSSKKIK